MHFFSFIQWVTASVLAVSILSLQTSHISDLSEDKHQSSKSGFPSRQNDFETQLSLWEKFPSFGFNNLLSDWIFLQFLQYFGDTQSRQETGYRLSPKFFEIITSQDPYYVYNYFFLSSSSSIYAGQPEKSVNLMAQGLQNMSPGIPERGYFVWRYKGTDELLFLGDTDAAQQSFQTAADWASQVPTTEAQSIAQSSAQTAQFLAEDPTSRRAQIDAWVGTLMSSFDEQTRRLAISEIRNLGGDVRISSDGKISVIYPNRE